MHLRPAFGLLLGFLPGLSATLPAQRPFLPQEPVGQKTTTIHSAPTTLAQRRFDAFLDRTGGEWLAQWRPATGTPKAIYGTGLPIAGWRQNSLEEARRHALQLLQDQRELLGLGDSEFREVIGARMGRTWSFTFDQFFRGLPVVHGRADVRVSMAGRIAMFGSSAWPIPADFGTVPQLGEQAAVALAWQAMNLQPTGAPQPAPVAPPRLCIWGDIDAAQQAPFFLAWEVALSNVDREGNGPIGRAYVDAQTGALLHFQSDKHECGMPGCTLGEPKAPTAAAAAPSGAEAAAPVLTTVTVQGWTRTGLDGFSALANVPLPGLVLNVPGIGAVTTDQNGQFTINIASPVSITVGQLDGRHHAPILGANAPSGSFNVSPGVPATIQLLTSAATTNQAAHTTTSWWTDRTNEFCRAILGNTAQLATASGITPTVNIASTCNAYYTNNTINFYQAGGTCNNTAFSTVVAHEWGHGLDDRYGGISQTNGLSEGWGDILGLYLGDTPILGSGFSTAGVGIRDGNNTVQYPASGGVHTMGQSWMGFAWKLRERMATTLGSRATAIAITNDIVISSIVADAIDQASAVIEVFVADDNDGNLANGTPHSADLIWACQQHSLPFPGQPGLANDECTGALPLVNGLNGPFTTVGALTSAPAWPCASGGSDVWFTYGAATAGNLTVSTCAQAGFDTALQIFSGNCGALTSVACLDDSCGLQTSLTVAVTPGVYYVRVGGFNSASGAFSLNVNGPGGLLASSTPYGTGCYLRSKAFYELMAAAAFDLGNSSMRLVRTASGYTAQPGGTYVTPPVGATQLTLGDDAAVSVTLAGSFPYPGGATGSLEVCSNGFVSVAPGNGTGFTPTAAGWLAGTQMRWGCWHDFNPSVAASGKVKFHEAGSVSYVTWDGVYSFGTTTPNTWQLQFDRANGNVTYVFQAMGLLGNARLVGCAGAGPNVDLGNRDISATLPATFPVGAENLQPLSATGTAPRLGTTMTVTTANIAPASVLAAQVVSLLRIDPGVDLGSAGMPGCLQFTGFDSTTILLPSGGQTVYTLAVPNTPGLSGLPLNCQTYAFLPGVNTAGVVASNGVAAVVGF